MRTRLTEKQRAAFAEMLRPHHRFLARLCFRLAVFTDDGEDLYQQAVLKALEKRDTLRDTDRFRSWMCRIIVNEHRNLCRKARSRRLFIFSARQEHADSGRARNNIPNNPGDRERSIHLQRCLRRLSPKKREALILAEVEGFPLAEIAEIQQCSLSAAKTRVSRARRELRSMFLSGKVVIPACPAEKEKNHAFKVRMETLE